jgi:hypothetical protein
MAVGFYQRDTNADTTCDTVASPRDLTATTPGTDDTITSSNVSAETFTDAIVFDIDTSSGYTRAAGTAGINITVITATDIEYRHEVRSVDDSGCGETVQDTGPTWSGTGLQTDTTGTITWPATDERLRLAIQIRRSASHGNKTIQLEVNKTIGASISMNGWTAVVAASPVIPVRQPGVRDLNSADVHSVRAFPKYLRDIYVPGTPPAAATPVIPLRIGQLPGDRATEHSRAFESRYIDKPPTPQANRVIQTLIGQRIERALQAHRAFAPKFIIKPRTPDAYRVIESITGQWIGDEKPGRHPAPKFLPFVPFVAAPVTANPVVQFMMGQLLDSTIPNQQHPAPFHFDKPPTPEANPVIEALSTPVVAEALRLTPLAHYYKFISPPAAPVAASPVVAPLATRVVPSVPPKPVEPFFIPSIHFVLAVPGQVLPHFVKQDPRDLVALSQATYETQQFRVSMWRAGDTFTQDVGGNNIVITGAATIIDPQRPWRQQ